METSKLNNEIKETYPQVHDIDLINKPVEKDLFIISRDINLDILNNKTHYLKSYIDRFQLLWTGKVRAEIRSRDSERNYKENDIVVLIEGHSEQGIWIGTGNVLTFKIKHLDTFGLSKDNVLLHYELLTRVFIKDIERSIKELKQFGF